ncbi:hypothetical protein DHEL01_v212127 [Diaporthe helianthi]|uniref:Enoyl reductase (ER) domain-containing protein n=1 Tax=Diaporthe helianthi TaxID=158607 RepID=A0A2P5HGV5_DIAHE|nr:hypothetical protein DHEL01_v212127 [Diaporthe helianthi]
MTKAYVAKCKGGEFALIDVSSPKPKAGEVSIRNKAVALNPVDWKKHQFGIMVDSWPSVFGADIAGVVESVGEGVEDFLPGDEVFSLAGHENRAGGFQEVSTVPSHFVARKPPSLSFEEAASLPVLVIGGGSGVGATAVQLLRLSEPSLQILATASQSHHSQLVSLGATACINRDSSDIVSDIMTASTFDVTGGKQAMSALGKLTRDGDFKPPLNVEIVGHGLESIGDGLEKLRSGVSRTKLIITL